MKFLPSRFACVLHRGDLRRNLRALVEYLVFLAAVIFVFSVAFHWIMWSVEGQRHSWITGAEIVMIGTLEQRATFAKEYER